VKSKGIIFIPNFVKISPLVEKLKGARAHTHTHIQHDYLISLLFPHKRKVG